MEIGLFSRILTQTPIPSSHENNLFDEAHIIFRDDLNSTTKLCKYSQSYWKYICQTNNNSNWLHTVTFTTRILLTGVQTMLSDCRASL